MPAFLFTYSFYCNVTQRHESSTTRFGAQLFRIHNTFEAYINNIINLFKNHLIPTCILYDRSHEKLYDEEDDVY